MGYFEGKRFLSRERYSDLVHWTNEVLDQDFNLYQDYIRIEVREADDRSGVWLPKRWKDSDSGRATDRLEVLEQRSVAFEGKLDGKPTISGA